MKEPVKKNLKNWWCGRSLEESRYYLIPTRDLEYGDDAELRSLLSEVSKLLGAYSKAILNSDFWLLNSDF